MRIELQRARSRWCFLSIILLIAGNFSRLAGRAWLAEYWNQMPDPELWEKAAELAPDNASYWLHLGVYHQENLFHPNERRALAEFRKAAQEDPHSAQIWLYTAKASENLGDPTAARMAYQKAQSCHPISAAVAWRYGSFLIRQADLPEAYLQIRRATQSDSSLLLPAISQFWEAGQSAREILDGLLPASVDAYFTALAFFIAQRQMDPALVVWQQVLELHQNFEMQRALPLVDELIRENHITDAVHTWREALRATNWPVEAQADGSLIFDGGFEHDVLNGGFAWREIPIIGAQYALDSNVAHSGARSLRVSFDGEANLDFAQIQQYVAVEPARRYRFRAFLRTERISTDSGVRFEIEDARSPAALTVFTQALAGTHPWTAAQVVFQTGPQTSLLLITLRRTPSRRLDNKLSGSVWADDVSLLPAPIGQVSAP